MFYQVYILLFLRCPVIESNLIKGVHKVRCFFAWKQKQLAFETLCIFKNLNDRFNPKKEPCVS